MSSNNNDFFGGAFDFNGDGKTDPTEQILGLQMLEENENNSSLKPSPQKSRPIQRNNSKAGWIVAIIIGLIFAMIWNWIDGSNNKKSTSTRSGRSNYYTYYSTPSRSSTSNKSEKANNTSGTSSKSGTTKSGGSTKKTEKSDPYEAKDYSHPDDFCYDHYDDFVDYEDAEDYYYEHGGE